MFNQLKPTLLIVDDNQKNLYSTRRILNELNISIDTVFSGEHALKSIVNQEYFLILMDVQMPVMDGFETVSYIRGNDNYKNIPIIFMTANNKDDKFIEVGYDTGAVDYLFKPINPHTLKCKIKIFLELYLSKKELQRRTLEFERSNDSFREYGYVVSHDLQEPLRMVISYIDLLEKRYKGKFDSDADEFIEFIVDGVNRMQVLINALLSYSQVECNGLDLKPVGLQSAYDWAVANLELAIDDSGAVVTHDDLPIVMGDIGQLGQLMQNLLGNAIKFRSKHSLKIHVSVKSESKKWIISVIDNGIGIEEKFQKKIFGIFQRLHNDEHHNGTGIGLSVCSKIVERHGGNIKIKSELGKGAVFSFSLDAVM